MNRTIRSILSVGAVVGISALLATSASAGIFYDASQETSGTGFGTQNNILTVQNPSGDGLEDGIVSWDGSTDVYFSTNGTIDTGSGKTATFSLGELGISAGDEILLVWNPAETGEDQQNQVDFLELTLYAPDGTVVWSDTLAAPQYHDATQNPGAGGDGFGYILDAAGILSFNAATGGLGDISDYRLGLEGFHSLADNGPDTWTISSQPGTPPRLPEPGILGLLGLGLIGVAAARRRRKTAA